MDEEFHSSFEPKAMPNFPNEVNHFIKKKFGNAINLPLTLDDLADFFLFDHAGFKKFIKIY